MARERKGMQAQDTPASTKEKPMLVRVGRSEDVTAGRMRVFEVAGTKVNVANTGGRLYASDDTRTHTGCSLAMEELDGTTVTFACHGSPFDVTNGAVLAGPARRPVRSHLVHVEAGDPLVAA
jgi:nitrite reductase/ring-hydroxylating ferredoxin subunit